MRTTFTNLKTALMLFIVFIFQWANAQTFVHPGILHKQADFDRMKEMVNQGVQPWKGSYDLLVASPQAQLSWAPRATATIIRGGTGDNVALLYNDVQAAYQHALLWKITGNTAYGNKAVEILNAWSATHSLLSGNADRYLASGIFGYQFANAAEIMRGYSGFDITRFKNYMLNVFYYPLVERFLVGNSYGGDHNDACITNYWANWDLCNMAAMIAIGVLCDDRTIYNKGIEYFKNGAGNGSITHAVPFIHSQYHGQWQESGRDQGHSILGVGLMACFCETAWNQGDDMYGYDDNRFRKGAEYVAKYNMGQDVPFTKYTWGSGTNCAYNEQTVVSSAGRGEIRPIWEMIYNHYAKRAGQESSIGYIAAMAAKLRPEGGPGGHATTFDQPGYGSLTFSLLSSPAVSGGTYKITNRTSGKCLDNLGVTTDGSTVAQWANGSSLNQQWVITYSGGYYKLSCVTGGKYLDSYGHTADGSTVCQWSSSSSTNQQWTITPVGAYYKIINRANGKCLDTGGGTANGSVMQFWYSGTSYNQLWSLSRLKSLSVNDVIEVHNKRAFDIELFPNPVIESLTIKLNQWENRNIGVYNSLGSLIFSKVADGETSIMDLSKLPRGIYIIKISGGQSILSETIVKN
jgi:hypothetical protein